MDNIFKNKSVNYKSINKYPSKVNLNSLKKKETPKDKYFQSEKDNLNLIPKELDNHKTNKSKALRPSKLISSNNNQIKLSNVRWGFKENSDKDKWEPIFKDTEIDLSKVKDVYFVLEPFTPEWLMDHALIYFEFEDAGKIQTSDGKESSGLVVSIEPDIGNDKKFKFFKGLKDSYNNIYQLGTWEDTVQRKCRQRGHRLVRYRLNLDDKQKQKLLKNSLNEAVKDNKDDYYHTHNNNCFSKQIDLLNTVLEPEKKIEEWIVPNSIKRIKAFFPRTAGAMFNLKGILDNSCRVITQPDKKMYPDKQFEPNKLRKFLETIDDEKLNKFLVKSGVVGGVTLGTLLPLPVVGAVLGAALGGSFGKKVAKTSEFLKKYKFEPMEKYEKSFP